MTIGMDAELRLRGIHKVFNRGEILLLQNFGGNYNEEVYDDGYSDDDCDQ